MIDMERWYSCNKRSVCSFDNRASSSILQFQTNVRLQHIIPIFRNAPLYGNGIKDCACSASFFKSPVRTIQNDIPNVIEQSE
jgi:hypothetical protein